VVVFLFSMIPILFVTERRDLQVDSQGPGSGAKRGGQTQWGQLFRIYGAHAFSWIGVQTMFVYIIAFIQQKMSLSTDPATAAREAGQIISISFAILNTVGFLLPAPILEPLSERFGRVRVHMGAVAIMAVGYFAIMVAGTTPLMLYVFMAVVGIGWASIVSLPFAIMTEKVEQTRMGFFMGIFNLSVVLPQLFVSLVLGSVIQDSGDKGMIFLISGVTLSVSALVWIFVREAGRTHSSSTTGGGA
jgi:maltose/moltooligosaccharide transporter